MEGTCTFGRLDRVRSYWRLTMMEPPHWQLQNFSAFQRLTFVFFGRKRRKCFRYSNSSRFHLTVNNGGLEAGSVVHIRSAIFFFESLILFSFRKYSHSFIIIILMILFFYLKKSFRDLQYKKRNFFKNQKTVRGGQSPPLRQERNYFEVLASIHDILDYISF